MVLNHNFLRLSSVKSIYLLVQVGRKQVWIFIFIFIFLTEHKLLFPPNPNHICQTGTLLSNWQSSLSVIIFCTISPVSISQFIYVYLLFFLSNYWYNRNILQLKRCFLASLLYFFLASVFCLFAFRLKHWNSYCPPNYLSGQPCHRCRDE